MTTNNNSLIQSSTPDISPLVDDLSHLIEEAKGQISTSVNNTLTLLYWSVGKKVKSQIKKNGDLKYGKYILQTLSAKLATKYGKGWSKRNLGNMVRFAEVYLNHKKLQALSVKLSWSHFLLLLPMDNSLKRSYYEQLCHLEAWSVRTLRKQIDSMLFERTALSKKPDELIELELDKVRNTKNISPDFIFKDPYILDFLELNDHYLEKDLEDAILRELEKFLMELGVGFSFIARQKRIQIDSDDFYIDLLFYNR